MAILSLPEEIVEKYSTDEVISWAESEIKTMRQIALSKEPDKAFLLGRITSRMGDLADVLGALRKKLNPKSTNDGSFVA